ncbi:MAG: dihydrodipicolinate reductase [Thermodesulfobacteriota bacterium]|nr:dihydrodipicolinate reductase [Thermodesulfobacteriota bacterium]
MKPINLMINGLPGNVTATIAAHAADDSRFSLVPFSLTGPEIETEFFMVGKEKISLLKPDTRKKCIQQIKSEVTDFITIDFTHPTAVNDNALFYTENNLPFVMGTTGGDREKLAETVLKGSVPAVIAPNMAKQIVGFQAMMDYASETFPDLFKGFSLTIEESHQKGKADTSGTARAMVKYFNRLGIPFSEENIVRERDPDVQKNTWEIPEEHLAGHGWHTYTLTSPDKSVFFQFKHNINGREIYVKGTFDGAMFLNKKVNQGAAGKIFTMIDVLKG